MSLKIDGFEAWLLGRRGAAKVQSHEVDFGRRKSANLRMEDLDTALRVWLEYVKATGVAVPGRIDV